MKYPSSRKRRHGTVRDVRLKRAQVYNGPPTSSSKLHV